MKKESLIRIIIEKLFCKHDWLEYCRHDVYTESYNDMPTYCKATFICKKCGKFKKRIL